MSIFTSATHPGEASARLLDEDGTNTPGLTLVCCPGLAVPAADARALWPSHRVRPAVVPGITQSPAGQDGATRDTGPHHAPQHTGRAYDAWGAPARGDQGPLGLWQVLPEGCLCAQP